MSRNERMSANGWGGILSSVPSGQRPLQLGEELDPSMEPGQEKGVSARTKRKPAQRYILT